MATVPTLAAGMSDEQQAVFYAQLAAYEKDEVAGVLLALFLGTFGAHHFYMRRAGLGVLYVVFSWTGIPSIAGFVECFFMPGRVRRFNLEQAMLLSGQIREVAPQLSQQVLASQHCPACGTSIAAGVRFCGKCGATV